MQQGCVGSSSAPCTPWWTRFERCAERPSAACTLRTLVEIDCRTENSEDGTRQRHCSRILRSFRECPGRAPEEIETVVTHSDLSDDPFPGLPPDKADAPLQPNLGEALQEFFEMAEELSRSLVHDSDAATGEAAAAAQQQLAAEQQQGDAPGSLLGRLFGVRREQAKQQQRRQQQQQDPAWREFERSFEEV